MFGVICLCVRSYSTTRKDTPSLGAEIMKRYVLEFSAHHSSDVPLVLNVNTGHISLQCHVVFDYQFSILNYHSAVEDPPSFQNKTSLDSRIYNSYMHRIPLDTKSCVQLHDEWLTPPELEERVTSNERQAKIRGTFSMSSSNSF